MTDLSSSIIAKRTSFRLTGLSRPFDPTRQAIRPDLADIAEAEHHFAPHYAAPITVFARIYTAVFAKDDGAGDQVAQLSAGAAFALLDITGGWAWGYVADSHIVGYVAAASLEIKSGS